MAVLFFIVSLCLLVGTHSSNAKPRLMKAMEHHLLGEILQRAEFSDYFIKNGMSPVLLEKLGGSDYQEPSNVNISKMFTYMDQYQSVDPKKYYSSVMFPTWVKFMITHPTYWIGESVKNRKLIFQQFWGEDALGGYKESGRIQLYSVPGQANTTPVIAHRPLKIAFIDYVSVDFKFIIYMIGFLIFLFARSRILYASLIIGFIGFTNAILGFWGEYWERGEMMRHALIGSLIFNISVSLIIFYVLQKAFLFLRKFN